MRPDKPVDTACLPLQVFPIILASRMAQQMSLSWPNRSQIKVLNFKTFECNCTVKPLHVVNRKDETDQIYRILSWPGSSTRNAN